MKTKLLLFMVLLVGAVNSAIGQSAWGEVVQYQTHSAREIKDVDTLSGAVKEEFKADIGVLSIYPNPASEKLFIVVYSTEKKEMTINLFDMQGRLILSRKEIINNNNIISVDLENLRTGQYLLKASLMKENKSRTFHIQKS